MSQQVAGTGAQQRRLIGIDMHLPRFERHGRQAAMQIRQRVDDAAAQRARPGSA